MSKLTTLIAALALALPTTSLAAIIIDNTTQGYYNDAIGTVLNGTNPAVDDNAVNTFLFPNNNSQPNDPLFAAPGEPDLSAAAGALGNWLSDPGNLNGNWAFQNIPGNWAVNSETAVVYEITTATGLTNLQLDIGVDNGIFVWLNGSYVGGQMAPGGSALGEFSSTLVDLAAGTHYLQLLREDHGGATGYAIRLTGDDAAPSVPEPGPLSLMLMGAALLLSRRWSR